MSIDNINKEDLFEYLISEFRQVKNKSMKHEDYSILIDLYNFIAIDLHGPILAEFEDKREKITNSLLYQRYLDISRLFVWAIFCVYSGAYRSAIRELRFIMESFILSYYLDKEYPNLTVWEKMGADIPETDWEKFGVDKLYGRKLIIEKARLNEEIYHLFKRLSKYVHSSIEELSDLLEWMENEGMVRTSFDYDENLFEKCVGFSIEVIDSLIFVLIQAFPKVRSSFKEIIMQKDYARRLIERSKLSLCAKIVLSNTA